MSIEMQHAALGFIEAIEAYCDSPKREGFPD